MLLLFPVMLNDDIKFILTVIVNQESNFSATLGRDFSDELNNINENSMSDPYIIYGISTGELFAQNSEKLSLPILVHFLQK